MISKYLWITDPHLNFLTRQQLIDFFSKIQSQDPTGIFLTGDISVGTQIENHLRLASQFISCPIYFVLGNHDFYRSNFESVKKSMIKLSESCDNLLYLNFCEPLKISEDVCVIGHDGWYDSRWREPYTSVVFAWDYFFIEDFKSSALSNKDRLVLMRQKADQAADQLGIKLKEALKKYSTVYLLTHFPPWPEKDTSWGGLVEKFWAPYNSSKIVADTLDTIMKEHSNQQLIILAGHTHNKRIEQITFNIELRVGDAIPGVCQIQDIICL